MERAKKINDLSHEDMIEELEQYYEAAGFTDIYLKELKGKTAEEVRELYKTTIGEEETSNKDKLLGN